MPKFQVFCHKKVQKKMSNAFLVVLSISPRRELILLAYSVFYMVLGDENKKTMCFALCFEHFGLNKEGGATKG